MESYNVYVDAMDEMINVRLNLLCSKYKSKCNSYGRLYHEIVRQRFQIMES